MAESGERRMLFDTRGRRKNVIRVVYAILALLMGASLFVAVGPFNIAELIGTGNSSSAQQVFEEQAERIEGRLAQSPTDEALLLALTRARISAGNAQRETNPETGTPEAATPEAQRDFEAALQAWDRYLKQAGDDPNPTAAQLVATTFFSLAESTASVRDAEANVAKAAAAQRIAAGQRPSVGSLTTLAIYEYFDSDFEAGDSATKRAKALAVSKPEVKAIEKQMDEYRKRGKRFEKQKEELAKVQRQVGKEQLQNPLGGLGGGLGQ